MISYQSGNSQKVQSINRETMLVLLETALATKAFRFGRQSALAWLSAFPDDLEINLYYAKCLINEGRVEHALPVVQKILQGDPEYLDALMVAEKIYPKTEHGKLEAVSGAIQGLGGVSALTEFLPNWGAKLFMVRQALAKNQTEVAQDLVFEILPKGDHIELIGITHLQIAEKSSNQKTFINLAKLYNQRWPNCVQVALLLAKAQLEENEADQAVNMLHFCAAHDPAAQVPTRLWGPDFPYRSLYPLEMKINYELQIPAEVAGKLGLNQLFSGSVSEPNAQPSRPEVSSFDGYRVISTPTESYPVHPKISNPTKRSKDPTIIEVGEQLKRVAEDLKQPILAHSDERFPAYVILSMRSGLEGQFGEQSANVIITEMDKLAKTVQERNGWTSIVFLPDDLEICGKYNITPVDTLDPWKIKLALVDLDRALEKTGERVGSVVIVGGDTVVPFHKLPNPTDDADSEIPSDSPYGAMDTNYYISDWPVGRLPGESGQDAGLLLTQLRNAIQYHADEADSQSWLNWIFRILFFWNQPWVKHFGNIGYTASIWRRSSLAAFRPIGEGRNLSLSPNGSMPAFDSKRLTNAPIGYFNLHGVEDGSEWYGQKDPLDKTPGPDFPVALKPSELLRNGGNPRIVYCEACYGGHIFEKTEDQSIALTLLGSGVLAMIGSTTISYGSVTTPLIGADLLGYLIMKNLREGLSIGSSMTKSKVEFVREMNRRQGYLDGEDQKTLISFVLYGDPLVSYDPYQAMKKTAQRDTYQPVIKTISDRLELDTKTEQMAPRMIAQAKQLVKDYLPGLEYAEVRVKNQRLNTSNLVSDRAKGTSQRQPERVVVSFSKQTTQADQIHKQYARVTLDQQGKMIKLAVSR